MRPEEKISVVLRNSNSTLSTNQFEVYDNVEEAAAGVFTVKGGESIPIYIRTDETGKGSVKIRNSDAPENEWVELDAIGPGDVIAP
jgi:hypothetical protein